MDSWTILTSLTTGFKLWSEGHPTTVGASIPSVGVHLAICLMVPFTGVCAGAFVVVIHIGTPGLIDLIRCHGFVEDGFASNLVTVVFGSAERPGHRGVTSLSSFAQSVMHLPEEVLHKSHRYPDVGTFQYHPGRSGSLQPCGASVTKHLSEVLMEVPSEKGDEGTA